MTKCFATKDVTSKTTLTTRVLLCNITVKLGSHGLSKSLSVPFIHDMTKLPLANDQFPPFS